MRLETYLSKSSNKEAENRFLRFIVVLIGGAVLLNTVMSFRALRYQRTILLPPALHQRAEIRGDQASEEYVRAFARYVMGLLASFTPATARSQFDELLTLYAPEAAPTAKKALYELADTIESTHITHAFYIQQMRVDSTQIEVRGARKQFMETTPVEEAQKTYLIDYRISDGRFALLRIFEKEGK